MKSKFTRTLLALLVAGAGTLSASAEQGLVSYAYDIQVNSATKTAPTVSYKLTYPAQKVVVQALVNGTVVAEKEGATSGQSSVAFDLAGKTGRVTFNVKVLSNAPGKAMSYWSIAEAKSDATDGTPTSVTVNRDPNSANFGQVLVAHTDGIQRYAADFTKGEKATYLAIGGAADTDAKAKVVSRLRYSDDGRLFALSSRFGSQGLYELNPTSLVGTAVFQGTASASDGTVTNGSTYVGGAGAGLDVYGSGSNLKVAVASTRSHSVSATTQKLSVYNLGTATTWSTEPTATSVCKYATTDDGSQLLYGMSRNHTTQVAFDKDGNGLSVSVFGGSSDVKANVTFLHADAACSDKVRLSADDGNRALVNIGAMAYNKDRSVLAVGMDNVLRFYNVTFSGLTPTLTHSGGTVISTPDGKNPAIADVAFDYAGNAYVLDAAKKKLSVYRTLGGTPEIETPAPNAAAYDLQETVPENPTDDLTVRMTEAKTYKGRTMVSLRWIGERKSDAGKPETEKVGISYSDLYRNNVKILSNYTGSSYIDEDLPDGKYTYHVVVWGRIIGTGEMGSAKSASMTATIKRDPAMSVYKIEEVYNYPIVDNDEKAALSGDAKVRAGEIVTAQGVVANMRYTQTTDPTKSSGAPGDFYRQGVMKVINGQPTWFISQVTDATNAQGTTPEGFKYLSAYGNKNNYETEKGGVIAFNADDPRNAAVRQFTWLPWVNQSLGIFDGWSGNKFDFSTDNKEKYVNFVLRANTSLTENAQGAGRRYLNPMQSLNHHTTKVDATGMNAGNDDLVNFPGNINFFKLSEDANHNPGERTAPQYYRTQYVNTDGRYDNSGRLFVPLNMSRDLYVFSNPTGNTFGSYKVYRAPEDAVPGTENYAIPIVGRKDFLHVLRSNNVYYVTENGEYTPIREFGESEKRSACGATFTFNHELFYIHPVSDHSNNPGHFRIDMPTRSWDPATRTFGDYTKADFFSLVPQVAVAQNDFAEGHMGAAGNSNAAFFGFTDPVTETMTINGKAVQTPVQYIYMYVPGVRFAKYRFYPKTEFPPVDAFLNIVKNYKDNNEDKNAKYGSRETGAQELDYLHVEYGWYPRPFEQEEGTNYVTDHYKYVVFHYDSNGNKVVDKEGTRAYDPNTTVYNFGAYVPTHNNGKGAGLNEQYFIEVTPVYRNASDNNDQPEGGKGYDDDKFTYVPGIKDVTATSYKKDDTHYRVDIDFNPGDKSEYPEPVSHFVLEYSEDGGNTWKPVPDNFTVYSDGNQHVGGDKPGYIPGDYDFNHDKDNFDTDKPDAVGYYFTNEEPDPNTQYRVTAVYADENPAITQEANVSTRITDGGTTAVEDIAFDSYLGSVKVYPVPAVDYVTVQAAGNITDLRMTAANGAIVKDEKVSANGKATLYVGDLPAGIYLLTVNGKHNVEVIKK